MNYIELLSKLLELGIITKQEAEVASDGLHSPDAVFRAEAKLMILREYDYDLSVIAAGYKVGTQPF